MSSLSLSSDVSAVNLDLAGEFAGVPPVVLLLEEPLPEAVVSSERLPPLMVISLSKTLLLPCWTWVPLLSLVMVMSPSPM